MASHHHEVTIIGGGASGISTAASLLRHHGRNFRDIAIIEPADRHYYQPAFTLVGAGAYSLEATSRPMAGLIPRGATWIQDAVASLQPEENRVRLVGGDEVTYDYLVVCPGIELHWAGIAGLEETLGQNGVCSNYSPETVRYTWSCMQSLRAGHKAVFTQPAMPIKCPGAPQKAAYLAADHLRRKGIRQDCEVHFFTQTPALFGVPFYAKELVKIAAGHGIDVHCNHNLVAVDGPARTATFEITGGESQGETLTQAFDMLHVTPPQRAPAFIRDSALANAGGMVDVDQHSLQHTTFPNVFALGDVAGTPNSKTAAAVRKQAPVVVRNLAHLKESQPIEQTYDGYASCPLTTAYGKVLMAEFIYGGKPAPTLPLNPGKERALNWWVKKSFLPPMYWQYMLKGYEAFPEHNTNFKAD